MTWLKESDKRIEDREHILRVEYSGDGLFKMSCAVCSRGQTTITRQLDIGLAGGRAADEDRVPYGRLPSLALTVAVFLPIPVSQ